MSWWKREPETSIKLPTNISVPEGMPKVGGLTPSRSGGCYCTGECRSNPCHPCNGGIAGRQQGWTCPTCGQNYAPWVMKCPTCAQPPSMPVGDCGCPPYGTCMNTACPRRIKITCETVTTHPIISTTAAMKPLTQEEIEAMLEACKDQL